MKYRELAKRIAEEVAEELKKNKVNELDHERLGWFCSMLYLEIEYEMDYIDPIEYDYQMIQAVERGGFED